MRTVRHSELRDFRQCPLKHRLRWIDGWQQPEASPASRLGTAWHGILQARYECIRAQQREYGYAEWTRLVRDEIRLDNIGSLHREVDLAGWAALDDIWTETLDDEQDAVIRWMHEGYHDRFGLDPNWEVLHVEEEMRTRLINPDGSKAAYWYEWHCDLAVKDHSISGKVVVIDHKSTRQPLGQTDVDLDDQFGLYVWAFSQIGYEVIAPLCNQAKTDRLKREMTLGERFVRIHSYRSGVEQRNIALDALATAKAIYSKANIENPYSAPNPRTCGYSCEFKETHLQIRKSPAGLAAARAALIARGFVREG